MTSKIAAPHGTIAASDIREHHWLLRLAPRPVRPYLRLIRIDRPIGTWLLLFPCWWGMTLAAGAAGRWPDPASAILFAIGALVMRGAGCTYNDIVDRDVDARVARTATRPIASGEIPVSRAWVFLVGQLLIGLLVLVQFNGFTVALGAASLLLVAAYPFMKRITYWPQAWLGLTFNWGALMGWAAQTGSLDPPAVWLYLAGLAWTLGYDTIYAHQDKEDDALVGVKSTALRLGAHTRPWLAGFYAAATGLMVVSVAAAGLAWPAYLGCAAAAAHLAWQVITLDPDDPDNCLARFRANRIVGWLFLAGLLGAIAAG
ncbi:MAG: 4-hydroxybenzoate octaprenyltransferase [Alphaproteobacteria bacterium]|nr:MAG: 4-hydroxybenzoate octaprenyltransferase [Alphaproteobacteria bacterium]